MKKYLKDKNVEIKIRLSADLKSKFFGYCKNFDFKTSERIRELMLNDINNGK